MSSAAKLVTIITVFEASDKVARALHDLGAPRHKHFAVKAMQSGFWAGEGEDVAFTVVTTEPLADKILAWVEEELVPVFPSIAYGADVKAVLGSEAAQALSEHRKTASSPEMPPR